MSFSNLRCKFLPQLKFKCDQIPLSLFKFQEFTWSVIDDYKAAAKIHDDKICIMTTSIHDFYLLFPDLNIHNNNRQLNLRIYRSFRKIFMINELS